MDDEDGFGTTPTPRRSTFLSFAIAHPTLPVSVVAALIFAIRCVIVTRGDPYTAAILLAQTSLGDAIRALLFSTLPFLLCLVATIAAYNAGRRAWSDLGGIGFLMVSVIALSAQAYLIGIDSIGLVDITRMILLLIVFGSGWLVGVLIREAIAERQEEPPTKPLVLAMLICIAVIVWIGPSFVAQEFWLPRERLVFGDGKPLIGYVLKTSGDHFVILNDDPRIIIEKQGTPGERDFCYPERYKTDLEKAGEGMPPCP